MYLLCKVSDLDVNFADRYGNTALHYVVWYSKDDNALLHWACIRGDVTEVLILVFVGGHKINAQDPTGNTPLHLACYNGHSDIVEILMLAGADETITNDLGETPARMAESGWHSELLKLLDIDSLWQLMLRQREVTVKWYHTLTMVHFMMKIRSIIMSNKKRCRKLKRKANSTLF